MSLRRYEEMGASAFAEDVRVGTASPTEPVGIDSIAAEVLAYLGLDEGGEESAEVARQRAEYAAGISACCPESIDDIREAVLEGYEEAWRVWKAEQNVPEGT